LNLKSSYLRLDQSSASSFPCTQLNNFHYIISQGVLANKPGNSDGSRGQLTTGADTCHLLQTQSPGLESGTWSNPIFCHIYDLQRKNSSNSQGTQCVHQDFSSHRRHGKLLAERIQVRILGHTGRILRSYLHDLFQSWHSSFVVMTQLENHIL
jgi:hypothetical protein